jgi:hypothetical protein
MPIPHATIDARRAFKNARSNCERFIIARLAKEESIRDQQFDHAARWRDLQKALEQRPIYRVTEI